MKSLEYAVNDATAIEKFFSKELEFEQVYHFSHNAPPIPVERGADMPSEPTRGNLSSFLHERFEDSFLSAEDNFWFFFSGHGLQQNERDYLIPSDGHPNLVEETAISLSDVTERLSRCGAGNIVLLIDACRSESRKSGLGVGAEAQKGMLALFSCQPKESAWEIEECKQGAFTVALLEGLSVLGNATAENLYKYIRTRVKEINRKYQKPEQTPLLMADPPTKQNQILLPRLATLDDIKTLKYQAYEAESNGNIELAEQLWTQVLSISPADSNAIKAIKKLASQLSILPTLKTRVPPEQNLSELSCSQLNDRSKNVSDRYQPVLWLQNLCQNIVDFPSSLLKNKKIFILLIPIFSLTAILAYLYILPEVPLAKKATVSTTVKGTASPWLAGMPDKPTSKTSTCKNATWKGKPLETTAPTASPTEVKGIDLIPASSITFTAKGTVTTRDGVVSQKPEGDISSIENTDGGGDNGIADVYAPNAALLGVFLGEQPLNKDAQTPSSLRFVDASERDYIRLEPQLRQVFFIGDGRGFMGVKQRIIVPQKAKRFYLGTMDRCNWHDNNDSFDVKVTSSKF